VDRQIKKAEPAWLSPLPIDENAGTAVAIRRFLYLTGQAIQRNIRMLFFLIPWHRPKDCCHGCAQPFTRLQN
jgi:hypothetical protein